MPGMLTQRIPLPLPVPCSRSPFTAPAARFPPPAKINVSGQFMLHHNPKWPKTLILTRTDTRRVAAHRNPAHRACAKAESVPDPAGHRYNGLQF